MNGNSDLVWSLLALLAIPASLAGLWVWLIAHQRNSVTAHHKRFSRG